ncbi:MAG TPA: 2-hydroxychromene-2-carboxylate isomerase [Candidatus Binatia bacterium]|jgi:2-hydroxychromene-2-carboxylate isomerase
MAATVEFLFDFGSPTTYLAWTQLAGICAEHSATLVYRPVLLGGIFAATGNASPATIPAKARYMGSDLARFARRYGVPFAFNPHFPINTLTMMRIATGLVADRDAFARYLAAIFPAMWVEGLNLGESSVLEATIAKAGLDVSRTVALASDAGVKAMLKAETERAVERGVFGAPSMFVGEELFFGQDRLDFVREALRA